MSQFMPLISHTEIVLRILLKAPNQSRINIAIMIYFSYRMIPKYIFVGRKIYAMREPSSGGIGKRLNTARLTLRSANCRKNTKTRYITFTYISSVSGGRL